MGKGNRPHVRSAERDGIPGSRQGDTRMKAGERSDVNLVGA